MYGLEHAGLLCHHTHDGAQQDGHVQARSVLLYHLCVCYARSNTTEAEAASASTSQLSVLLNAMASLADGNASFQAINTTFADGNRGFQAGTITGHVNAEFHHYAPGRPSALPASHAAKCEN